MVEWRPFAHVFVPNTFKEFLEKHDYITELRTQQTSVKSLRYQPSSHDVEEQKQRLLALRRKVVIQRRLIKQKDAENSVKRRLVLERELSFRSQSRQERPLQRSKTRNVTHGAAAYPRHSVRMQDDSVFFSLTEVATEGKKAKGGTSSLPALQQTSSRR